MTVIKVKTGTRVSKLGWMLLMCGILIDSRVQAQDCIVFGPYSSDPAVAYTCGLGFISFNYSSWVFTNLGGGNIRVAGSPTGTPPALIGALNCNDSTFTVDATLAGTCTETYSLQGRFGSDTSWAGTFNVSFSGSNCLDCTNQTFLVAGTTNHVSGVFADPLPIQTSLDQNFPNPFNPTTQIRFSLSQTGLVSLKVYTILGQHVETLVNGRLSAGSHLVQWHPRDLTGGVYYYRFQSGGYSETKKLLLLK